ncbi:ankyrin repeat-containing protein ITN1-like [Prunus avium]|uniref:Ankyrin repeat-containing protein ITN1-like n=1 Tax=Prunus avium TaxID=42229 RepID=A0A6P5R5V1_PRUAV|nr:ankyrin repeat-containing protein ITN1-like [Prunus avium]
MCDVTKHRSSPDFVLPAIFRAIERGMFEFTDTVLQARPDLMWFSNQKDRNLFHFAIECRQEKIYSLIYRLNKRKRIMIGHKADKSGNCALHVAGMLSPLAKLDNISGAALQMQRELQWFQEVETIVLPRIKESPNYNDGMMPCELFTRSHKELVKEGERWMKESATSCTVVGALIITMMFAAAFTVPGGNNGETGFPIFLHKKLFMAFMVSDAISLFSSTTSVLMFLGILTSRYAEDDFLKSLPTKMIIGLSTLFISIATMMVAFSSALFIMIHEQSWIVIPMIFLASVPVTLFIWMQFPLLVEMYISTYGGGIVDKKVKSRA